MLSNLASASLPSFTADVVGEIASHSNRLSQPLRAHSPSSIRAGERMRRDYRVEASGAGGAREGTWLTSIVPQMGFDEKNCDT